MDRENLKSKKTCKKIANTILVVFSLAGMAASTARASTTDAIYFETSTDHTVNVIGQIVAKVQETTELIGNNLRKDAGVVGVFLAKADLTSFFGQIKCFFGRNCPTQVQAIDRAEPSAQRQATQTSQGQIPATMPVQTLANAPIDQPATSQPTPPQIVQTIVEPTKETQTIHTITNNTQTVVADQELKDQVNQLLRQMNSDRPNFSVGQPTVLPANLGAKTLRIDSGDFSVSTGGDVSAASIATTGDIDVAGNVTVQGNFTVAGAQTYSGAAAFNAASAAPALTVNQTGSGPALQADKVTIKDSTIASTEGILTLQSLASKLGLGSGTNEITNTDTDASISINPNGTGRVQFHNANNYIDKNGNLIIAGAYNGATINYDSITFANGGGLVSASGEGISFGGAFTTSGAFPITLTASGITTLTLPTTGTLATLAGNEALTNKTINGITPAALTSGFTLTGGSITPYTLSVDETSSLSHYALLAGRTGGQKLIGGTGTSDILTLQSTSDNATATSTIAIQALVGNNGGTAAMTILNSGNIGIGTTGPLSKLDVSGGFIRAGSSGDVLIGRYDSAHPFTASHGYFKLGTNNTDDNNGGLTISYLNSDAYQPGISLISSGNVGIGTTSPGASLDISNGNYDNGTSPAVRLGADLGAVTRTDATRKIGTITGVPYTIANPPFVLLSGDSQSTYNNVYLGGGSNGYDSATGIVFYTGETVTTKRGTERARINNLGDFGIGTTSPTSLFQVTQPTTGVGIVTVTASGTAVTGTNTQFLDTFKAGDTITANNETHTILGIASNTSLTTDAWTNAAAGVAYTLVGGNRFAVSGNGNIVASTINTSTGIINIGTASHAFGDSITAGVGASNSATTAYVPLLAAAKNWTTTNHGVSGSQAIDQGTVVYPITVSSSTISTLMIGTNDQRIYQYNTDKLQVFQSADEAIIAWLAIPSANKILGTSSGVTYTGTWSTTGVYGIGKNTTTSGATATFSVYGKNVLIAMIQQNSQTGTFTVSIDGVSQGSFLSGPVNGTTVTTTNGGTYGPKLFVFPNVGDGNHTVVITTTNTSHNYFDWAAGTGGTTLYSGPTVYVGNIPRYSAAGYTTYGGSDANIATYNRVIENNVAQLASMGLNVVLADVSSLVNPATDLGSDGLHPNDAGHAHIKDAFLNASNSLVYARDRQNAQLPIPNIKWDLSNIAFWIQNGAVWTERARFNINGDFGIGTTSPISLFQVTQPTTGTGTVTVTASGTTVTGTNTQFLNTFKVGDTITANSETHTISAIASNTSMNTDAWTNAASGVAYTLVGGDRFTVFGNGNVGIGTTNPATALQVVGDIRTGTSGTNGCVQGFGGAIIAGTCSSDSALKTNITYLDGILSKFSQIKPVTFNWNDTASKLYRDSTTTTNYGLIAQDLEQIFPELVATDSNGYKMVNYSALNIYVLEAIKEQQNEINNLKLSLGNDGLLNTTSIEATSTVDAASQGGGIIQWVVDALQSLGMVVKDGVATLKELAIDKLTAKQASIDQIQNKQIQTNQVCISGNDGETVCITKDQLKQIINTTGTSIMTTKVFSPVGGSVSRTSQSQSAGTTVTDGSIGQNGGGMGNVHLTDNTGNGEATTTADIVSSGAGN